MGSFPGGNTLQSTVVMHLMDAQLELEKRPDLTLIPREPTHWFDDAKKSYESKKSAGFSEADAKGPTMMRCYFSRLAMAPALVDIETRRMADRAESYAKGRVEASGKNLVCKVIKKIVGCAARARSGKTFMAVIFENEGTESIAWESYEAFETAGGLLRGQISKLLEFKGWLAMNFPDLTLPIPKVQIGHDKHGKAKYGIRKTVYYMPEYCLLRRDQIP